MHGCKLAITRRTDASGIGSIAARYGMYTEVIVRNGNEYDCMDK